MEKHLANFVCYVEQGVFPEMLISLKRCKTGQDMQMWMDSLGDYLSDFERMKNFTPPAPKEAMKEEQKVEVPILEEVVEKIEDPTPKKEVEEMPEDSMQERVWKYIKILDNEIRTAAFEHEHRIADQNRHLTNFERMCRSMSQDQQQSDEVKGIRKSMIAVISQREQQLVKYK